MIYDTFPFFNELELLEIRLHELAGVVDKFVLVEATRTHSSKPKPLYFADNKSRFASFADRIIHVVVEDMPDSADAWVLERYHRNAIARGLRQCQHDDFILVSDTDEIPRATVIPEACHRLTRDKWFGAEAVRAALKSRPARTIFRKRVRKINPFVLKFEQRLHYYFLNCVSRSKTLWCSTSMLQYRDFTTADEARYSGRQFLANGGWHFRYMGGVDRIRHKLSSFAHREFDTPECTDPTRLTGCVQSGHDLLGTDDKYEFVELDETYPRYILENRAKFAGWIKDLSLT